MGFPLPIHHSNGSRADPNGFSIAAFSLLQRLPVRVVYCKQRVKGLEMPSMLDGFSRGEGKAKTI